MRIMSLGGNCAGLSILGPARVPGPVDNWSAQHGFSDVPCLFENFREMVLSGPIETKDREKGFSTDSDKLFIYEHYRCVHIDMRNPETVDKVLARHDDFLKFAQLVSTERDCWFSYTLNEFDVRKIGNKRIPVDHFVSTAARLSSFFPIEKLVFIGTPRYKQPVVNFDFFVDCFPETLNYVEIPDVDSPQCPRMNAEREKANFNRLCDFISGLPGRKHLKLPKPEEKKPTPTKKKAVDKKEKRFVFDDWDD